MKPNKISKEEWMAYCDKLTASQSVMEMARRNEALIDAYVGQEEVYDFTEWTGAKQGTTIGVEEEKQWEIDRLHRKIKKLELELSEVKFEVAMLKAELNATRGRKV